MKKIVSFAGLILAVGTLCMAAHAQDAAKKTAPPKPMAGPSAAVLKQWNEIGRKLIDMAQDFPEAKYDFKAAPTVGSFAERLIHSAAANYFFTNIALGQKAPGEDQGERLRGAMGWHRPP